MLFKGYCIIPTRNIVTQFVLVIIWRIKLFLNSECMLICLFSSAINKNEGGRCAVING